MGPSTADNPTDTFRSDTDEANRERSALDQVFCAGTRARREGTPLCDNPYAVGSPEREEWSAGWRATVKPEDEDEEPNSGYEPN
jgi:hypothetical protein